MITADEEIRARLHAALASDEGDALYTVLANLSTVHPLDMVAGVLATMHPSPLNIFTLLDDTSEGAAKKTLRFVLPAVARLSALSLAEGISLLEFANRVEGSRRHLIAQQLTAQMELRSDLAKELGNALLEGLVTGEGAQRVWAGAFVASAAEEAARYTVAIAGTSEQASLLAATIVVFLDCHSPDIAAILQPQGGELTAALIALSRAPGLENASWQAICAIANFAPDAMAAIEVALKVGPLNALFAVSRWLEQTRSNTLGGSAAPLEGLLERLIERAGEMPDLWRTVDSLLSTLLYQAPTRPSARAVFIGLGRLDVDLGESVPNATEALAESASDFAFVLTTWLTESGIFFNTVRSLLSQCISTPSLVSLDASVVNALPDSGKARAVRRLLALTHNGPTICAFAAVFAETATLQPDGISIAAEMLNYVLGEYPGATESFLKAKTRPALRSTPHAHVYRNIYANALRWRRVLQQLPVAKEFVPSDIQMFALQRLRARMNADILRSAKEKSIFAQISTKLNVRQGRRFATHTEFGAPQITEMRQVGGSIELPSSERADPVGGMLHRTRLLGAAR